MIGVKAIYTSDQELNAIDEELGQLFDAPVTALFRSVQNSSHPFAL